MRRRITKASPMVDYMVIKGIGMVITHPLVSGVNP